VLCGGATNVNIEQQAPHTLGAPHEREAQNTAACYVRQVWRNKRPRQPKHWPALASFETTPPIRHNLHHVQHSSKHSYEYLRAWVIIHLSLVDHLSSSITRFVRWGLEACCWVAHLGSHTCGKLLVPAEYVVALPGRSALQPWFLCVCVCMCVCVCVCVCVGIMRHFVVNLRTVYSTRRTRLQPYSAGQFARCCENETTV